MSQQAHPILFDGVEYTFGPDFRSVTARLEGGPISAYIQEGEGGRCHVQFSPEPQFPSDAPDHYGATSTWQETMSWALRTAHATLLGARERLQEERDEE